MGKLRPGPKVVDPAQVDLVVEILVGAFFDDPLWSWALPDPLRRRDQHRRLGSLCLAGAMRYPWVWLTAGDTAASVWIPPGGSEFSEEQAQTFSPIVMELLGPAATRVFDAFGLLEKAHPHDEPHYYLSLLGTDPLHRGHGHGLGLLADNLLRIDEEQMPAYLEASNPANVALYRRHGFEVMTSFTVPDGGPEVSTMWREPRAG